LDEIGVNHVALNLRFNQADMEESLKLIADDIMSDFSEAGTAESREPNHA
jgi:hypothetical protein